MLLLAQKSHILHTFKVIGKLWHKYDFGNKMFIFESVLSLFYMAHNQKVLSQNSNLVFFLNVQFCVKCI